MPQTVAQVMTTSPTALPLSATVADAARHMRDEAIGDVLVVDGDALRGVVTDRDIVVRGLAAGLDGQTPLGEVCSPEVVAVHPDDSVDDVIRLMADRAIRRVPVVEGERAVGIVAIGDLAQSRDPSSVLAEISAAAPSR